MENPFSPIRQSRVSDDIVSQIKYLIREGSLKPGDKLPAERDLAKKLEVGRSSLREAINSLALMGLVEVRQRKGIYVRSVGRTLVTEDKNTIAKLYDIRMDIEVAAAAAAADNRSAQQLTIIRSSLHAMKNKSGECRYCSEDDMHFHITIANATGNFLRVHIIQEIFDLAGGPIKNALARIVADQDNIKTLYGQHADIVASIADRSATRAGSSMHAHLSWVKAQLDIYL
jgi:GntR family transcriptional repressor for pyruvate dehydrogenase complex